MTNLLQFTIKVWKPYCQPQCTSKLLCEDLVLFVWADLHISVCRQRHSECERAIRLASPPFFCKICSSSNPKNRNLTDLDRKIRTAASGNHLELDTCSYELFNHNGRCYHLPKYCPFLLNHPVLVVENIWWKFCCISEETSASNTGKN